MKKNNKNNNHKFLSKNYIKGAISGALHSQFFAAE